ncbi:MAG: proteasome assembly chaperone family protein [Promethearchaeota archaeon]
MSEGISNVTGMVTPTAVLKCIDDSIETNTLIVGFPNPGLAGTIAAKHIIQQLKMKTMGYIRSPLIPPHAVFWDGILAYPYRIHGCGDAKLSVLIGEAPVPTIGYYYLAKAALDWAEHTHKIKEVICLGGFPLETRAPKPKVYLVAEPDLKGQLEKFELPLLKQGYISDFVGAILNEAIINEAIHGYALFVESTPDRPDPVGAIRLIEELNRLKELNIDTKALQQEATRLQTVLDEFARRTHAISQKEEDILRPSADRSLYV